MSFTPTNEELGDTEEKTYLTFFLRFFVPKPTYDMFANGHKTQQNTTKRKKHATMVVSRSQLQRHELL